MCDAHFVNERGKKMINKLHPNLIPPVVNINALHNASVK